MDEAGRRSSRWASATFAFAAAAVVALSLREAGAFLALRGLDAVPAELGAPLDDDADLRVDRARARLAAGDAPGARDDVRAALTRRPRDPDALLLAAYAAPDVAERLRLALLAARVAPYQSGAAEFALATALAAVDRRGPRAADARERARRLREASLTEGLEEALAESARLEGEMRGLLATAIAVHGATSPTARGMRFLGDALARARGIAAELDAP